MEKAIKLLEEAKLKTDKSLNIEEQLYTKYEQYYNILKAFWPDKSDQEITDFILKWKYE